jgi:hypothetical protein
MLMGFAALTGLGLTSCVDQPDAYEVADGTPTIDYIRLSDVTKKDSMLTGAHLGENICIVGNNLRSIKRLYFNDQPAILNTSFITDHTLLVDVPDGISDHPTDKIYMVNNNNDTTSYDFKTLVPQPVVSSLNNEYAKDGDVVTLKGDYLLTYDDAPLKITFPGNVPVTDFKSISRGSVTFTVPEGAQKGIVTVESKYGKSNSSFYFRDDRCLLFDFDGSHKNALANGHGWRNGVIVDSKDGIQPLDGKFLYFGGAAISYSATDEDHFSINYWPEPSAGYPELKTLIPWNDPNNLELKFEVNVPNDWTAGSMDIIFTSNDQVTYTKATNSYIWAADAPRALWTPWYNNGTAVAYKTSGWQTVSIPLTDFIYDQNGNKIANGAPKIDDMTGLSIIVMGGPYKDLAGENNSPAIAVDNIRICPIK